MIDKKLLIAKAQGVTEAYKKMAPQERVRLPDVSYGEDYNNLRALILANCAPIADLLPPEVQFSEGGPGIRPHTKQAYATINTHCEQIIQILSGWNS